MGACECNSAGELAVWLQPYARSSTDCADRGADRAPHRIARAAQARDRGDRVAGRHMGFYLRYRDQVPASPFAYAAAGGAAVAGAAGQALHRPANAARLRSDHLVDGGLSAADRAWA